jgi:integrase
VSTSVLMEFPAQNDTPRSIAELRDRIIGDPLLSAGRRSDMASALTSLAKALGCPPETILTTPTTLRPALANLTAAMVGLGTGRWRNIQSLTAMALAHAGIILVHGRIREPPSPAWSRILDLLKPANASVEPGKHFHLWRFARYVTLKGIAPATVDDAVIAGYLDDLEHRSLVSDPARAARDAARFWNAAADAHPGWPQQRLSVADNRPNYALPMESYPDSLRRDIDAWTKWLSGDDPFMDRDFNPLRPTSISTRLRELREYLAALVDRGAKQGDMVDLASVVTPAQAKRALRFFWDRAGKQRSLHSYHICNLVLSIARHWAKLPKADVDALRGISNQLRPLTSGITPRNVTLLRQLEDPDRLDALLTLPTRLTAEASRADSPTIQLARQVQTAAAVELLLHVPLRMKNLRELRIGVELRRGPGRFMSLAIPGDQVKNDLPINACLPEHVARLITLYLDHYRPLLTTGAEDWLFPGASPGAAKTEDGLRGQIQKAIAERCGLRFNPHLFRHFAAWITLRQNPDAHGQVQRILNHKSLAATMAYYSGLEAPAALQHYDKLVGGLRDAAVARTPQGRRPGSGK